MAEPGFTQFLGNAAQFKGKPGTFRVCVVLEEFQLSRQEGDTNSCEMLEIPFVVVWSEILITKIQRQIHQCFSTFAAMEKSNRIHFSHGYFSIYPLRNC